MSISFGDLWNELTAQVRVLDPLAAKKFINRAWIDIGQSYEWSWLRALGVITAPAVISTGTIATTQFSRDVTFSAAAATVLDAVTLDIPLGTRQLKVGGGPSYNIATYTPGGAATLDPNGPSFQESTVTAGTYQVLKAYYAPPATDFARFISVRDPISGYYLRFGPKWTQERLDRVDPLRSNGGQPLAICNLYTERTIAATGETSAYTPKFEIWPNPTQARSFEVSYRRRTTDFVNDDDLVPDILGDEIILTRAKLLAYEWAEANKANEPLLMASNWFNLIGLANAEYKEMLKTAIKEDRETFPNRRVSVQVGVGQFSPEFLQSHENPYDYLRAVYGY